MRLYHGSNVEIDKVDFSKCKPFKDFGRGFYLTTIEEQARKMAKRVSRIYGGDPVVTVFDFNMEDGDDSLNIRTFDSANVEWAIFVLNNRNRDFLDISSSECNHDCKYDIVIGPVANDDLALLFRQFENGLISVETLVEGMKYKKLTDQYTFHSDQSLKYLRKAGVIHV